MIRSNKTGTADDKIVIVGAHYDTTPNTTGIDDNGSGTTALLQVAKNVGKSLKEQRKFSQSFNNMLPYWDVIVAVVVVIEVSL